MPTVFNRMYAFAKTNGLSVLNYEQKTELGKLIVAKYYKEKEPKPLKRVKAKPFDCDGMVLYYPKEFTPKMDKIIKSFFKKHSISEKPLPKPYLGKGSLPTNNNL